MTPQGIRQLLKEQPFRPFRLIMSSGKEYVVRHPEMALLTRREVVIALPQNAKGFPEP